MTAEQGGAPLERRKLIYAGAVAVLLFMAFWGIIVFKGATTGVKADSKAKELRTELANAGLPTPSVSTLADTFGTDGGMVCQDPMTALGKARYKSGLVNGASGPGSRPIIADRDVVQGEVLVIGTYCPDQLGAFTKQIKQMKFEDTT